MNDENSNIVVPEYLLELSNVGMDNASDSYSGIESNERLSGEGSPTGTQEESDESLSGDGSVTLDDLLTSTDTISDSVAELRIQVDNLNENVVTMNENLKVATGLLFSVSVILVIQVIFKVFNKVLGLGSC